jgi:hypothetical protein
MCVRTYPFFLLHIGLALLLAIAGMLLLGLIWLVAAIGGQVGPAIILIFLLIFGGAFWAIYKWGLYFVKISHTVVVAELMAGEAGVPGGFDQIKYGIDKAKEKVGTGLGAAATISGAFLVDQLISGVLEAIKRSIMRFTDFLPEALHNIVNVVLVVLKLSLDYVDESVMGYAVAQKKKGLWEGIEDGLTLYAMAYKSVLTSSAVLIVAGFLLACVFTAGVVGIELLTVNVFGKGMLGQILTIGPIVAAVALFIALWSPFSMVTVTVAYLEAIKGLEPDAKMKGQLESLSTGFRDIRARATREAASFSKGAGPQAPQAPPPPPVPSPGVSPA